MPRCLLVLLLLALCLPARAETVAGFSAAELRAIEALGPWPQPPPRDASNRFSGSRAAAAFGRDLFFDDGLSRFGSLSCASCHKPDMAWSDGRARASAAAALDRNTPSVLNSGRHAWLGWDGGADSLWMQSIRPLLDKREMAADAEHVRRRVMIHAPHRRAYRTLTGIDPGRQSAERVLVDTAKALAAFQETLATPRTPFDDFRAGLAQRDTRAIARYPEAARRGLGLFIGRGRCSQCHGGALLGGGDFYVLTAAARSLPHGSVSGVPDRGRADGLAKLAVSPYTRLGPYSDSRQRRDRARTKAALAGPPLDGAFRVPPLRGVAATAPYMHDGSRATLAEAVRHIADLPAGPVTGSAPLTLPAVTLSETDVADLVAFLASVSEPVPDQR